MSLYCVNCRTMAEEGSAVCRNCANGFVSRLACTTCERVVPSGQAYCSVCARNPDLRGQRDELMRRPAIPQGGLAVSLPPLPGLSIAPVRESYDGGSHGAIAEVQMSGRDADILTKMRQTVVLLHALAQEMNGFVALADSTRKVIKGCRLLAADLQEEVETRIGPAANQDGRR